MVEEEGRYALIIASGTYEDSNLSKLNAPGHDAKRLASLLGRKDLGGFEVTLCADKPKYIIEQELEGFFKDRKKADVLLVYFSCHGILDDDTGYLYIAGTNTKLERLKSTAVSSIFINDLMSTCRSKRQILILDCCHSGAFERGTIAKSDKQMHTREHFDGQGRVIITASNAMQNAFEGTSLERLGEYGSFFTDAIVEGISTGDADENGDGHISYEELFRYAENKIKEKKPGQQPKLWALGIQGDIIISRNPSAKSMGSIASPMKAAVSQASEAAKNKPAQTLNEKLEYLLQCGNECLQNESYSDARVFYDRVLQINPKDVTALNNKGIALLKQKQYEEANNCFTKVLEIYPADPTALTNRKQAREELAKFIRTASFDIYNESLSDEKVESGDQVTIVGEVRNITDRPLKVSLSLFTIALTGSINKDVAWKPLQRDPSQGVVEISPNEVVPYAFTVRAPDAGRYQLNLHIEFNGRFLMAGIDHFVEVVEKPAISFNRRGKSDFISSEQRASDIIGSWKTTVYDQDGKARNASGNPHFAPKFQFFADNSFTREGLQETTSQLQEIKIPYVVKGVWKISGNSITFSETGWEAIPGKPAPRHNPGLESKPMQYEIETFDRDSFTIIHSQAKGWRMVFTRLD